MLLILPLMLLLQTKPLLGIRKSSTSAEQILVEMTTHAYTCMTVGYNREDYIKFSWLMLRSKKPEQDTI